MNYFFLKPDHVTVSKYFSIKEPENAFSNGINLYVDDYYNDLQLTHHYFSEEDIKYIEESFKKTLDQYGLILHYDNLMYLALCFRGQLDEIILALESEYLPKKRIKELAKFLLTFKSSNQHDRHSLQLKTLTDGASLKDNALINWIGETVLDAALSGRGMTLGDFSLGFKNLHDDIDKLKEVANKTIRKPKLEWKYYISDFCFFLYPYLINETDIRPDGSTMVSDNQLKLYYELLTLLHMIEPDAIESDPQDYMRTILRNKIRPVKT